MSTPGPRWSPAALALVIAVPASAQDDWRPFQFRENEEFRYDIRHTEDGEVATGFFSLSVRPSGDGLKIDVQGKLDDMECSGSMSAERGQVGPQHMWTGCMTMAPVMMAVFMPLSGWFMGRSFNAGDKWEMRQGDESFSFNVTGTCSYAGRDGRQAVMKVNDDVRLQACVDPDMALPLAVTFNDEDGDGVRMELVTYRR